MKIIIIALSLFIGITLTVDPFAFRGMLPGQTGIPGASPERTAIALLATLMGLATLVGVLYRRKHPLNAYHQLNIFPPILFGVAAYLLSDHRYGDTSKFLWILAVSVAILLGFFSSPLKESQVTATSSSQTLVKVLLMLLLITSGVLYEYRLSELPTVMDRYGSAVIVAAQRLLNGQLPLHEIILFQEMTQEDCIFSLPYVAWHAGFQLIFGGESVVAARTACVVASLISVHLMYRVGRALLGTSFGLWAATIYALSPLTFHNARHEGIFAFSAMLILFLMDVALSFRRSPTVGRAILLGIALPLTGYGIANIRLMALPVVAMLALSLQRLRKDPCIRRSMMIAGATTLVILTPQIMNLSTVYKQVQGRGEHLFGGSGRTLVKNHPDKSFVAAAGNLFVKNGKFIASTLFKKTRDVDDSFAGPIIIFAVAGFGLCVARAGSLHANLFLFFIAMSIFAPLIAIPLGLNRTRLLGLGESLFAAAGFFEVTRLYSHSLGRVMSTVCSGALLVGAMSYSLLSSYLYLSSSSPLHTIKERLLELPEQTVVFMVSKSPQDFLFTLWNKPAIGNDTYSKIALVGVPAESAVEVTSFINGYLRKAAILVPRQGSTLLQEQSGWRTETLGDYTLGYPETLRTDLSTYSLIDLPVPVESYTRKVLAHEGRGSVTSSRSFEVKIPSEEVKFSFQTASHLEKFAIIPRTGSGFAPPANVLLDGNAVSLAEKGRSSDPQKESFVWLEGSDLAPGEHLVTLRRYPNVKDWYVDGILVIGKVAATPLPSAIK